MVQEWGLDLWLLIAVLVLEMESLHADLDFFFPTFLKK